ncbi:pantoate--beta-alanine ligase [Priestia filamentosa]|uniref:Pantothenate synthetase n=1 Tax=Priestia filamentosa TaxID=1402861 RepID=A0A1X7F110_9BACI|nr:pantoate--beta-alanine ligase [Priestia filamentosa]OXS67796.1 pantoate--beta-alanine ligase [Priestia filamentosa]RJS65001.1 pantoate--beta-alanine ligase [Priestia filamentosa]SMF44023.1 pantoate--beta-alanine ligase [Priestia filamentosa]
MKTAVGIKIIKTVEEMKDFVREERKSCRTVGFVPTMGFLHEGHLTLIKKAKEQNDTVILSIFVNPTQFGPNEDFEKYPRDEQRDLTLAAKEGVDVVFLPSVDEMYPTFPTTKLTAIDRTNVLCGKSRPGHFDGVVTVLSKLFHITMPDKAYFGLKDAQQVAVTKGLVEDYFFPIEIIGVETVREEDGLAKSSRNVYLTEKEREQAPHLYESLRQAITLVEQGERNKQKIRESILAHINEHTDGEVDYVDFYRYPSLEEITVLEEKIIIAIAVKFSQARLIDNVILDIEK